MGEIEAMQRMVVSLHEDVGRAVLKEQELSQKVRSLEDQLTEAFAVLYTVNEALLSGSGQEYLRPIITGFLKARDKKEDTDET
tara:strand:- start:798 stop:1046 length:249 start_codon:yes stop_codon:yes gene_type:complete